jgi:ketosteroid isomerase-like protein
MRKFYILCASVLFIACAQKNKETKETIVKTPTAVENNVALTKTYFEHFNNHDWQQMAGMYATNAQFKDPSMGPGIHTPSQEEIIEKYSELGAVFTDLKDEIVNIYPSGENFVVIEFVSSGTAPDGSVFELPICTIFKFENEKITQDFSYFDNFEGEE